MKYQIQMSDKYQFCGKMMIWFEFHVDFTWKFNDVEEPNHQKHEKSMWWFSENQMHIAKPSILPVTSMLMTDVGDEMCWWQLYVFGDGFDHLGQQHPLSFYISVGH